jgi:ATPase family AAA domain-containing protein 3A/B
LFIRLINWFAWQEKQRIVYDEEKKLAKHQAEVKSQMAKYDDELARKRMQVLH